MHVSVSCDIRTSGIAGLEGSPILKCIDAVSHSWPKIDITRLLHTHEFNLLFVEFWRFLKIIFVCLLAICISLLVLHT